MINRFEIVSELKYGDQIFRNGDLVIFSVKEGYIYKGKLDHIGQFSFIAYGDDGEEYDYFYDDIEKMELFKD